MKQGVSSFLHATDISWAPLLWGSQGTMFEGSPCQNPECVLALPTTRAYALHQHKGRSAAQVRQELNRTKWSHMDWIKDGQTCQNGACLPALPPLWNYKLQHRALRRDHRLHPVKCKVTLLLVTGEWKAGVCLLLNVNCLISILALLWDLEAQNSTVMCLESWVVLKKYSLAILFLIRCYCCSRLPQI